MMRRPSLVFGSAADWAKALHVLDRGPRRLPPLEANNLLDTLALAVDAERETREHLVRRQIEALRRRPKP